MVIEDLYFDIQYFGLVTVILGLYFSAELGSGSGSMIALVAAMIFALVAILQALRRLAHPEANLN